MLINKLLQEEKYIFVNNCSLDYLKTLIDLEFKPIITQVSKKDRKIIILTSYKQLKQDSNIFLYDVCNKSDIKKLLKSIAEKLYKYKNINYILLPYYKILC